MAVSRPKLSIVIPTLNEERYLGECLSAIRSQPLGGDAEIIVADAKSDDATVEIAKAFGAKVVFEPKRTISAGRQAGAAVASGDILVFTDADAKPPQKWLSELSAAFADDSIVCAYGSLALYDYRRSSFVFGSLMSAYLYWAGLLGVSAGAGSNMAVRKRALHSVGGFDTSLVTGEDIELQKRLRKAGGRIVFRKPAKTFVSARRLRQWGVAKFLGFHASNMVKLQVSGKGHDEYEPIR